MRTIGSSAAALAAVLLVAGAAGAAAADEKDHRTITVRGDAEVKVAPDEVTVILGVETSDKDLTQAKSDNDMRTKKVIAAAERLGIKREHVATDHISVQPVYRNYNRREEFLHYLVRKNITVTLKDISKLEKLLTDALQAEATHIHGVHFRTTELRKHRDNARALALKAAREKAVDLAAVLGEKVGRPRMIADQHSGRWWYPYGSWWGNSWGGRGGFNAQNVVQSAGGGGGGSGSIALGQISVTASVSVTFELEDR